MALISKLFMVLVTEGKVGRSPDTGTNSQLVLIVNVDGEDRVVQTLPKGKLSQRAGHADIYQFDVAPEALLYDSAGYNVYYRIGIRGNDKWKYRWILLWGTTDNYITPVPLANRVSNISEYLSASEHEGNLETHIFRTKLGTSILYMSRVTIMTTTADQPNAGTKSKVTLLIASKTKTIIECTFGGDSQPDKRGNFIVYDTFGTFQKVDISLITLSIDGEDSWLPASFWVFGLEGPWGGSSNILPLVSISDWTLGRLSTNPAEGVASIELPLLP